MMRKLRTQATQRPDPCRSRVCKFRYLHDRPPQGDRYPSPTIDRVADFANTARLFQI